MSNRSAAISAGWTYAYSHAINMEYAIRNTQKGPEVMTADKTYYSPDEIRVLAKQGKEITPKIHMVKRIFEGTIVDYRPTEKKPEEEKKHPENKAPIPHHDPQLGLF
jgi:hypothetical protein